MNKKLSLLAPTLIFTLMTAAQAAVVITPESAGGVPGSGFQNPAPFFDAQPATPPTAGTTTDSFGSAGAFYLTDGRAFYFDFGPNFANLSITEAFLGLKQFGSDPSLMAEANFYWSPTLTSSDLTYQPITQGHIAATGTGAGATSGVGGFFNIFDYTADTPNKSWQSVWTGDVTPSARYFIGSIVDATGGATGNRVEEIVFTGTIPEPSTGLLLGLGALALACSRRICRK